MVFRKRFAYAPGVTPLLFTSCSFVIFIAVAGLAAFLSKFIEGALYNRPNE